MTQGNPSPLTDHSSLKGSLSLIEDQANNECCVPTQNKTTRKKEALSKYQNDVSAS
jgi:hypothetical protein